MFYMFMYTIIMCLSFVKNNDYLLTYSVFVIVIVVRVSNSVRVR